MKTVTTGHSVAAGEGMHVEPQRGVPGGLRMGKGDLHGKGETSRALVPTCERVKAEDGGAPIPTVLSPPDGSVVDGAAREDAKLHPVPPAAGVHTPHVVVKHPCVHARVKHVAVQGGLQLLEEVIEVGCLAWEQEVIAHLHHISCRQCCQAVLCDGTMACQVSEQSQGESHADHKCGSQVSQTLLLLTLGLLGRQNLG